MLNFAKETRGIKLSKLIYKITLLSCYSNLIKLFTIRYHYSK
jgi:hypothetical protein